MLRSFPRKRESSATRAGVRGPWMPALAGMSGDEEHALELGDPAFGLECGKVEGTPVLNPKLAIVRGAPQLRDSGSRRSISDQHIMMLRDDVPARARIEADIAAGD